MKKEKQWFIYLAIILALGVLIALLLAPSPRVSHPTGNIEKSDHHASAPPHYVKEREDSDLLHKILSGVL